MIHSKYRPVKIFVDDPKSEFIRAFKIRIGENRKWEEVIKRANAANKPYPTRMFIVSVNFRKRGPSILGRAQNYMSTGFIVIDKKFDKLIMQMRIARTKENGNLYRYDIDVRPYVRNLSFITIKIYSRNENPN